ncbi:MAG TPA: hypothetical protein DCG57_13335 [Candidatus Riflebacteria bacterium]|nr:hypothetical protein [Candidatus Riflebacteria bacterium]
MSWPDDDLEGKTIRVRFDSDDEALFLDDPQRSDKPNEPEFEERDIYGRPLATWTPDFVELETVEHAIRNKNYEHGVTTDDEFSKFIIWLFVPVFDELAAGLLAYLIGLLYWFDLRQHPTVVELWNSGEPSLYIVAAVYLYLALLSLYHVFRDVPKSADTKKTLAVFSGGCCMFSGIMGGYYLYLYGPNSYFQIFGIWNMAQGAILLFLLNFKYLNERHCTDRDTPFIGAIFNFGIVSLLYFFLKNFTSLYWVDCFAICVAYIMAFSSYICDQISPPAPAKIASVPEKSAKPELSE